jgi:ketosteroid isomerase-like protein
MSCCHVGLRVEARDTERAMSQENVELVRRAIDAYNRREVGTLQALNHPDIGIDWSASVGPHPQIYRGQEEAADVYDNLFDIFKRSHLIPERFIEAGDAVVVPYSAEVRGRDGIRTVARSTLVHEMAESLACVFTRRPPKRSKRWGCGSR